MNKRRLVYILSTTLLFNNVVTKSLENVEVLRGDITVSTPQSRMIEEFQIGNRTKEDFIKECHRKAEEQKELERYRIKEEVLRLKREEEMKLKIEEEERKQLEAKRIEEESRVPHFNPYNLRETSNLTRDKAYKMLEGSALQSAAHAYIYAEEVYGVNAIFLMALTSVESGHGRSELAMYRNNIGGVIGSNGEWAYFSDWGECIMYIANFLSESYLSEDGVYFNGYSVDGVNVKYCQDDSDWSGMITEIGYTLLSKV